MRKVSVLLLLLSMLSTSICLPLVNVMAYVEQPMGPPIPDGMVVIIVASGVLILISWSVGVGILSFMSDEVGKPPPNYSHSLSDQDMNICPTDYAKTLLTSILNGNVIRRGHNLLG